MRYPDVDPHQIVQWSPGDPVRAPDTPGSHVFLICLDPSTSHGAEIEARRAGLEIRDTLVWFRDAGHPVTVVVARVPLEGTVAANVLKYGTGAINVDLARIPADDKAKFPVGSGYDDSGYGHGIKGSRVALTEHLGRWPTNVVHDGSGGMVGIFPSSDRVSKKGSMTRNHNFDGWGHSAPSEVMGYGDSGSAARFFHTVPDQEALVRLLTTLVRSE